MFEERNGGKECRVRLVVEEELQVNCQKDVGDYEKRFEKIAVTF